MKHDKKIALATLAIATVIAIGSSAGIAQAHDMRDGQGKGSPEQHRARMERRLDQAVKDGKLTDAQKQELEAKLKENHDQMKEIRKTEDKSERKEKMKSLHENMQQWLKDHNIDLQSILPKPFRR